MGSRYDYARRRALAVAVAVAVAAVAVPATAAATALPTRITGILRAHGFAGAATSVRVFDLSTGTVLYARHSATELLPASNEKLVTSTTALAKWGADYRFKTELLTTGTLGAGGVYRGRIYLKGFGDPSLSTGAYQQRVLHLKTSKLSDFVTALKNAGVKKIVGRVVGDDSYFDRARSVASWKPGMTEYCGPLSALSLNEGLSSAGGWDRNPPLYIARQLTALLIKAGIPVTRTAIMGTTPTTATVSYTESSARLSKILAAMNKPSDNFFAEMLTKGLGASFGGGGTTARGLGVERAFLVSQGIGATAFHLTDGSGLSYRDRVTTLDLTTLLEAMSRRPDWPVFWRSLSVAGVDGTLAERMRGTIAARNLHGKTGTLSVASNLSGYVLSRNGEWLTFSMLMNRSPWIDVSAAHAAQDAIGVALAGSSPAGKIVWTPSPAPTAN